jgi:acyl carrier protein
MSQDEILQAVLRALVAVAPEIDPTKIDPGAPLREQADIDSMDFLNFVIGLHKELGVTVPETDYPKLATINSCVAYLCSAVAATVPRAR